ncbi:hypothetical protein [Deinococcus radiodurans]|uniref:hypothetical protein n=1 Tax=Deinococcus radiodurans TaxID=1299 RepID=UPI00138E452D|nr:hypothetical protein [Deinococcus radiodurans]QIP28804.1 hypothetical protein HAV23_06130 [Deinococcus radiodurans]QIP32493.1 hypothetical protein HAV35_10660 [Deinococcus radiodurans]UTA50208.1 hypothetical protein MSS93_10635 [Deinococcus radiodurans]
MLSLSGCGMEATSRPQLVVQRPSLAQELACKNRMEQVMHVVQGSDLPMAFRSSGYSKADCSDLFVTVAGFVTPAEVAAKLSKADLQATVKIIPPPQLQLAAPSAPGPLQLRLPARLTARHGAQLVVPLAFFNTGAASDLTGGESNYDYELLNTTGQTVSYRGINIFTPSAYTVKCPAKSECPFFPFRVPLNRMNERLPLPAGEYTLRVRLKDLDFERQKLDFGVFDIPVTITP